MLEGGFLLILTNFSGKGGKKALKGQEQMLIFQNEMA